MKPMRSVMAVMLASAVPAVVSAQHVSGWGGGFNVLRRVVYQGATYEQTGAMVGGGGEAGVGPLVVVVEGVTGTLKSESGTATESKIRSTSAALLLAPVPWLRFGGRAETRVFESSAGETGWRLIGANARFAPSFGSGFSAFADGTYFVNRTTSAGAPIEMAVEAVVGARYESRGPILVQVGYRFERFDFEVTGPGSDPRLEQYQGITAAIGVRLGRY